MMIRFSHVTISMSTSFDCRNSTTTNQANLYIYTKNTLIRTRLKDRTRKCDITKCFIISKYIKISHVKASNHTPTIATALSLLCIYLLPWAGYVKKGPACMVWINGFVTHGWGPNIPVWLDPGYSWKARTPHCFVLNKNWQ